MKILVEKGTIQDQPCDMLVTAIFQDSKTFSGALAYADQALNGLIKQLIEEERWQAKADQTLIIHTHNRIPAKRILIVGLGEKKNFSVDRIRRMAGSMVAAARPVKAEKLAVSFDGILGRADIQLATQAFVEGARLGDYQFLKYKGHEEKKERQSALREVMIIEGDTNRLRKMRAAVEFGQAAAEATIYARDLVNEPAVHMKPKTLAKEAEELGKASGVNVTVYSEAQLNKLKMGAFLAVAQGSDQAPYLIHLVYMPKVKSKVKKIVLCGKGITFDSGGLSLKPAASMDAMKTDMAGAAAILGVFSKIAEYKPKVEVHGVVALAENMPSGKAIRPGDVVTAYNKKTVEILNTDAEGRLILADALSWAEETIKPDYMIDMATLTGAAIVALGQEVAAMLSDDKKLVQAYHKASQSAGEPTWELPLVDEYRQLLHSDIADIRNIPKTRWADTIVATLFLSNFVEKTPWLHVDIAGPAWIEKQVLPHVPTGASGFGVRSLINLLLNIK